MTLAPIEPSEVFVGFALDTDTLQQVDRRPIFLVTPDPNSWNDYGHGLFAYLTVIREDGEQLNHRISIMFEGHKRTYHFLTGRLTPGGAPVPSAAIEVPFVSLQREAEHYETIVAFVGFDAAIEGLRGLRDVVLARIERNDEAALQLFDTEAFHIGMTRNASQYIALRRGGRHLRRTPAPDVADAAQSFDLTADLPSSREPSRVSLDFEADAIFQDRCCVLIGRNGVGKTQFLNSLISALADQALEGAPPGRLGPRPSLRKLMVFSSVPSDPYPRSVAPWTGLDYEYHPLVADERPLGPAFLTAVVDCLRDEVAQYWGEGQARSYRLDILKKGISRLGFWEELYIPIKPNAVGSYSRTLEMEGGAYLPISAEFTEYRRGVLFHAVDWNRAAVVAGLEVGAVRQLSSGEIAMAGFVAQAAASIERGSMLLFDEPETHLHPNFVSEFMDLLQDLLTQTRSVALIATHSAYVVREVPRQRVNVLRVRDLDDEYKLPSITTKPIVDVVGPQMQTFGASIDDISRFVFGDGTISHRYQRVLQKWAETEGARIGIEEILKRYGNRFNAETLSFVARIMRAQDNVSGS